MHPKKKPAWWGWEDVFTSQNNPYWLSSPYQEKTAWYFLCADEEKNFENSGGYTPIIKPEEKDPMKTLAIYTSTNNDYLLKKYVIDPLQERSYTNYKIIRLGLDKFPSMKYGTTIVLGTKCLNEYQKRDLLPKNRVIKSLRGGKKHTIALTSDEYVDYNKRDIFVSYDPFACSLDTSAEVDLETDLICAYRESQGTKNIQKKYSYVTDFSIAKNIILKKSKEANKSIPVAIDLETMGLDYIDKKAKILSISITFNHNESHVIYLNKSNYPRRNGNDLQQRIYRQLKWILNTKRVKTIGANIKFDLQWIARKLGITCTNFTFDVVVVGSLLNENRSNSLNTLAKLYSNMPGYDDAFNMKHDKSQMHLVPKQELLPYAAGDTDSTYQVYLNLKKRLFHDKKLTNFYDKVLRPAVVAFAKMEFRGVLMDIPYMESLQVKVQDEIKLLDNKAYEFFPSKLRSKYKEDFNLNRACIIQDFMFSKQGLNLKPVLLTEKTQSPSTSLEHLEMFEDHEDAAKFVQIMRERNSAVKTESTYVRGWQKHIRSDGRIHPSYFLYKGFDDDSGLDGGTDTGRTSAKDPAIQTTPKHTKWAKLIRKAFIAPPGYVFLSADYSQAELRIMAVLSYCYKMLKAYKTGIDVHALTACSMVGMSLEQFKALPEERRGVLRQNAKAVNFGLIYKMSPSGLVAYAKKAYSVVMSLEEAETYHSNFLSHDYPEIRDHHKAREQWVRKMGYVRSPLGRIRHLPLVYSNNKELVAKAIRQSINSPVQSTASDLTIMALNLLDNLGMEICLMIHDNDAAYVKEDEVEDKAVVMAEVMENLPLKEYFNWDVPIPFTVDVEAGYNLGELKPIHKFIG